MRYFLIILLFVSLQAIAQKHITVNNVFTTVGMQQDSSLVGGDTIRLTGTIGNCAISGLTGTKYKPIYIDASRATIPAFGGTINFDSCNYVYAFAFNATDSVNGRLFKIDGKCNNFTLDGRGATLGPCGDYIFDLGSRNPTTYTGLKWSYRENIWIKNYIISRSAGGVVYNSQDNAKNGKNVIIGLHIENLKINRAIGGGQVMDLLNCYNVDIGYITFMHTDSAAVNHSSNIYIKGSGHIHHLYNFDGRGNLVRAFAGGIYDPAHGIITDSVVRIDNWIDLNKRKYPGVELNFDPADTNNVFRKGPDTVSHFTIGNTTQEPLGASFAGACDIYTKNVSCTYGLLFNISRDSAKLTQFSDYVVHDGTGGVTPHDSTHCYVDTNRVGNKIGTFLQIDTLTGRLKSTSPMIGKGLFNPNVPLDFYGISRNWGGSTEPGAVHYYIPFITSGGGYKKK